jgi:hypothetical protein
MMVSISQKRSNFATECADAADHYNQSAESLALKICVGLEEDNCWEDVRSYQTLATIYNDMAAGRRITGVHVPSIEALGVVE